MITETFNNYLLSVAEKKNAKNAHNNVNISHFPVPTHIRYLSQTFTNPFLNIKIKCLSTKEVLNIVKSLKSKNSHGYDELSTKVLRMSSPFFSSLSSDICYTSLTKLSKIYRDKSTV
jgi:hypothetical protein